MESVLVFGSLFLICILFINKSDRAYLNHDRKSKKQIVFALFIVLFLIGALRNPNTGTDTKNYVNYFTTWRAEVQLSDLFKETFSSISSQQGYMILERLFYNILPDGQVWLAFLCLVFLIPCAILIYRYSECPPISFIYLVAMTLYTFSWQGLKQTVAMAICLFAFICLVKKKRILFLAMILLAFQFHKSSIVFLLALPASYLKVERWDFLIILSAFLVSLFAPSTVTDAISQFLGIGIYDKLELYLAEGASKSTYTMFFILLIVYIGCFSVKRELIEHNPINKILFNMSIIGISLQAMAVVVAEFFRVSYYFSIFNMLLVANAGQLAWEKHPRWMLRAAIIVFLVVVFFAVGVYPYWFFWENKV